MSKRKSVRKRYRFDSILKNLGVTAIFIACLFLVVLLGSIIIKASSAFIVYQIKVDIPKAIEMNKMVNENEANQFLQNYIGSSNNYLEFFSIAAAEKIVDLAKQGKLEGEIWLPASAKLNDKLAGYKGKEFTKSAEQEITKLNVKKMFNYNFFIGKESREPELAGIATSFIGSLYSIFICILVSLPISVCAAIYLEEFAPKNIITSLIEININNLAAVPSIVFGLLGLAVLIGIFNLPRSASITAGITLAMMILPGIIITTRQAFRTLPTTIKHAALALGATKMQVILHHTLPLAIPGIMTGVILSIARAIGETAPLILIGMVAFIVDIPSNVFDPATVMPVQIFLWADSPEYGFQAKTAAAILVLLCILILINMIAVYIRKKYEHRW